MKKSNIILALIVLFGAFLRFYHVDQLPPGLYIDEASIGYNAYTILKTGKDEYGAPFPLFFRSFGDYKPPVYIYMTTGAMALFGKSEFAVRFPSALFGTATIVIFYFFVLELFKKGKSKITKIDFNPEHIALVSSLLLSFSPWHVHFSRAGFEVTVALFFYMLGSLLALIFWDKKATKYLIFATLSFAFAVYTYHTYKLLAPITYFIYIIIVFYKVHECRKMIGIITLVFILLCLPVGLFSLTPNGSERFTATSAFSEYLTKNTIEKIIIYPMVFLKDYFSFFSLDFLFSHGDQNGRHQIAGTGLFYKWQLPFVLFGLVWLFRQRKLSIRYVTLGLLLLAPLIPAIARPSPNTLRSLLMVIPISMLIGCGMLYMYNLIHRFKKIFLVGITILAVYGFVIYLHDYYVHYPNVNALDWGAGYKQMFQSINTHKKDFNYIVIDKRLEFAETYAHFYDPSLKVIYSSANWGQLMAMKGKVLFISAYYGNKNDPKIIDQIYLPGPNKDIYAQIWDL
jgi:4-amino-4-deoxy-L-arabinose transferase-like glycosyltransferase